MPKRSASGKPDQQYAPEKPLSFSELLSRDSDTAPPQDDACKKFLASMQVPFDGARNAKDTRREQACAILWTQLHKDDPAPVFTTLPDAQRRQLTDALGLDPAVLKKDTWPTAVVRRAVAYASPGETPKKKKPGRRSKEQQPGAHGQLSKSGGR